MSDDAEMVARRWLAAWATHDLDAICADLAEDCLFVNGTVSRHRGVDEIRAVYQAYFGGYAGFRFEPLFLAVAPDGETVLNERIDYLEMKDGPTLTVPCAGAIKVVGGRITEIRDYFDFAAVQKQRGPTPPPIDLTS